MTKKDFTKSKTYNKIPGMIGKTFKYLTVLGFSHIKTKPVFDKRANKYHDQKFYYISCKCICNTTITIDFYSLNRNTFSCDCVNSSDKRQKYDPLEANAREAYLFYVKNKPGSLSFEEFLSLAKLPCYYCGAQPSNICRGSCKKGFRFNNPFIYSGLDRVDNSKGHEYVNCVPCCYQCNGAKSNHSKEKFLNWIRRVYLFQEKIKNE